MRYNKALPNTEGNIRIIKRFLLFPCRLRIRDTELYETRWLETVRIKQVLKNYYDGISPWWAWEDVYFCD
jgi:hypothetical protein